MDEGNANHADDLSLTTIALHINSFFVSLHIAIRLYVDTLYY